MSLYIITDTVLYQCCVIEELLHQNLSWLLAFPLFTEMDGFSGCHSLCNFCQSQNCNRFFCLGRYKIHKIRAQIEGKATEIGVIFR